MLLLWLLLKESSADFDSLLKFFNFFQTCFPPPTNLFSIDINWSSHCTTHPIRFNPQSQSWIDRNVGVNRATIFFKQTGSSSRCQIQTYFFIFTLSSSLSSTSIRSSKLGFRSSNSDPVGIHPHSSAGKWHSRKGKDWKWENSGLFFACCSENTQSQTGQYHPFGFDSE